MDTPFAYACTLNRDQSWLAFNRRVLEEAMLPERQPLDRLMFFGIYLNNLDEFFRVRVGTLLDQCLAGVNTADDKTGWTSERQMAAAIATATRLDEIAAHTAEEIKTVFARAGIAFLTPEEVDGPRSVQMTRFFKGELKPLLSPIVIDPHHPFPFLRNCESAVVSRFDRDALGVIPLGRLPAFRVFSDADGLWTLQTARVVRFFAAKAYGRLHPTESVLCRVTRNADLPVEEHEGEADFRGAMRDFVRRRKKLAPVRVELSPEAGAKLTAALMKRLNCPKGVEPSVRRLPFGPEFAFGLAKALPEGIAKLLSTPSVKPAHVPWAEGRIADRIRERDRLLHFPFESIQPFVRLLEQAADDPDVTAIRITLYRLASNSRIAQALARAAENGKDVLCVLELRARFDEESNINYAEMLQDAGCTVIYGLPGYKVHAKVCLIIFRGPDGENRTITQIGTGNYNEKTAALYTDLSYMTADAQIGADAARLFRHLCIGEPVCESEKLLVAPKSLLSGVLEQLDEEIRVAQSGQPAYAFLKVNGLNNMPLIDRLIEASCAGVRIDLHVRGICCIRPGIPGKTENIRVTSIVGTYLEHARIFCFGSNGRQRLFIGSGDFLNRNLNRRVEVYTPILDEACRQDLLAYIEILRSDTAKGRRMQPDGTYILPETESPRDAQLILRDRYAAAATAETKRKPTGGWRDFFLGFLRLR